MKSTGKGRFFLSRRGVRGSSLVLFCGLVLCLAPLEAVEVSFQLAAGLSRSNFSLINRCLDAYAEKLKREAQLQGWPVSGKSVAHLETGTEMEAGLQIKVSSHLGFSLCAGFVHFEVAEDQTSLIITKETGNQVYARPTKASALPVSLNLIYFLPLKEKFQAYFRAGGGLFFLRYIDREANRPEAASKFVYPVYQNASASSPFLISAAGFSFQIESTMALIAEINYRAIKVQTLEGEDKAGNHGPLEFYEEYLPSIDYWQAKVVVVTTEPSPEVVRSRQRSVVDFSGFSFKIGMTVRF